MTTTLYSAATRYMLTVVKRQKGTPGITHLPAMSPRKAWFLLILLPPIPAVAAQIGSTPDCRFLSSDQTSESPSPPPSAPDDVDLVHQKIARLSARPARSSIMPSRYMELGEALAGYCKTGVPLVASDGPRYFPAGFTDDLGIYYFIPRLALLTHLELPKAIDLFFKAPEVLALLLTIVLLLRPLGNRWVMLYAILSLFPVARSALRGTDVYSFQTAAALSIVPWSLSLAEKKIIGIGSVVAAALVGIGIGFVNFIRSHGATGAAIFLIVITVFHRQWNRKQKLAILTALAAGLAVTAVYFHSLMARRDAFLAATQPDYTRTLNQHPFWHSAYIGFSFVPNPYVPSYDDTISAEKVRSIDPSVRFLSPEYERILRGEVFRLVREHPRFAAITLLAKLRAIGLLLLASANLGLLAAALYPKPWPEELAFWSAMAFGSLFGILIIPHRAYMLGFIAIAVLYGIVSLEYAVERRHAGEPIWFHIPRFSTASSVLDRFLSAFTRPRRPEN